MAALLYEKKGRIAYITLNRPDKMNAINSELMNESAGTWVDFRDDDDLWVAVMTGAGKLFCAGADFRSLGEPGTAGSSHGYEGFLNSHNPNSKIHFPIPKERKKQRAGSLSGGEQQMLAIGRGLMSKPRLLLMDEPSIGLSPLMVDEIASIIRTSNKQRISVFIVEQNAAIALRLADRGYVMETGKIVLGADRNEVLNDERVKKAYLGG
jgi:hypothetical protein